jgi:hypothetical protein
MINEVEIQAKAALQSVDGVSAIQEEEKGNETKCSKHGRVEASNSETDLLLAS